MAETNYPRIGPDGLLYEATPQIVLTLTNNEQIKIDYFGKRIENYLPTRYMTEGEFIPIVKYLSKFKTTNEVIDEFLKMVKNDMKQFSSDVMHIRDGEYIMWNSVCKIDIRMRHYVYCLGKVDAKTSNSKYIHLIDEPFYVGESPYVNITNEVHEVEEEDDIDYDFLKCSAFEESK